MREQAGRDTKADQHRNQADNDAGDSRQRTDVESRRHRVTAADRVVPAASSGQLLDGHKHYDHRQQHRRQPCGSAGCFVVTPRSEDAGGKGVKAAVVGNAEVGQRFHDDQRRPGRNGWPGQRQGHAKERRPGPATQRSSDLHGRPGVFMKGRTGGEVDVRIKRKAQQHRRPADRVDRREPVVSAAPVECLTQQRLHRTRKAEQIDVRVGRHVRRHRQRQEQRPPKRAPARKIAGRHKPGRCDSDDDGNGHDADGKQSRVECVVAQPRLDKVRPLRGCHTADGLDQDRHDRHRDQGRHGNARDRPRVEGAETWHSAAVLSRLSRSRRSSEGRVLLISSRRDP